MIREVKYANDISNVNVFKVQCLCHFNRNDISIQIDMRAKMESEDREDKTLQLRRIWQDTDVFNFLCRVVMQARTQRWETWRWKAFG